MNGVKTIRYQDGCVQTPETEYWLIEHERTHQPHKRGDDASYTTPQLFAKSDGSETILELMVRDRLHRQPRFDRQAPTALGGFLLPPGMQHRAFGLHHPHPDGLVSIPKPLVPTHYPTFGPGRITAGLSSMLKLQIATDMAAVDRVRAKLPDEFVERHHDFILQHPEVDIGEALQTATETRMLAARLRFNEGVGKIKKRKEKSNEHKVRGRSRSRHR